MGRAARGTLVVMAGGHPFMETPVGDEVSPTPRHGVEAVYLAKIAASSPKALNSSALPEGSRKNMVACSPGWPLKRT